MYTICSLMYFKHIPISLGNMGFCGNQPTKRCEQGKNLILLFWGTERKTRALWSHLYQQNCMYFLRNFVLTSKPFQGQLLVSMTTTSMASSSPPAHWWHRTEEGHMWWIELCISYNYGYSRKTTIYPISWEFKMLCSWHDAMDKAGQHVKIQIYCKLDCEPYVIWSVSHIKMHFLVSPSAWMQNTWVFNFPWFFPFFFSKDFFHFQNEAIMKNTWNIGWES